MRRRGVVVEDRRPSTGKWNGFETLAGESLRTWNMTRDLMNNGGVKPDDVVIVIGELSVVAIV